jgi:peptidoglycan/LPS O-acetylase OafA/YrhL
VWNAFWALGLGNAFPDLALGAAGVDVFFVISGFIMVYVSEPLFGQKDSPKKFFVRRVIRVVPLYWMFTTLALIGWHGLRLPSNMTWLNVVGSFLFIPTTNLDGTTEPLLFVGWTLNYEMFFYVVFAAATLLSRRTAVLAVTAFFLVIVILPHLLGIQLAAPFAVWRSPIVFEFAFGMWIALAFREGLRVPRWLSWVLIAAGVATLIRAYLIGYYSQVGHVVGWGGSAAMIVAAVVLADVKPATSSIWRGLVFLGDASYALYLVHTLIPKLPFWTSWLIDPAVHNWLYAAMLTCASISVAIIVHLAIERPVTAYLRRKIEPLLAQRLPQNRAASSPDCRPSNRR